MSVTNNVNSISSTVTVVDSWEQWHSLTKQFKARIKDLLFQAEKNGCFSISYPNKYALTELIFTVAAKNFLSNAMLESSLDKQDFKEKLFIEACELDDPHSVALLLTEDLSHSTLNETFVTVAKEYCKKYTRFCIDDYNVLGLLLKDKRVNLFALDETSFAKILNMSWKLEKYYEDLLNEIDSQAKHKQIQFNSLKDLNECLLLPAIKYGFIGTVKDFLRHNNEVTLSVSDLMNVYHINHQTYYSEAILLELLSHVKIEGDLNDLFIHACTLGYENVVRFLLEKKWIDPICKENKAFEDMLDLKLLSSSNYINIANLLFSHPIVQATLTPQAKLKWSIYQNDLDSVYKLISHDNSLLLFTVEESVIFSRPKVLEFILDTYQNDSPAILNILYQTLKIYPAKSIIKVLVKFSNVDHNDRNFLDIALWIDPSVFSLLVKEKKLSLDSLQYLLNKHLQSRKFYLRKTATEIINYLKENQIELSYSSFPIKNLITYLNKRLDKKEPGVNAFFEEKFIEFICLSKEFEDMALSTINLAGFYNDMATYPNVREIYMDRIVALLLLFFKGNEDFPSPHISIMVKTLEKFSFDFSYQKNALLRMAIRKENSPLVASLAKKNVSDVSLLIKEAIIIQVTPHFINSLTHLFTIEGFATKYCTKLLRKKRYPELAQILTNVVKELNQPQFAKFTLDQTFSEELVKSLPGLLAALNKRLSKNLEIYEFFKSYSSILQNSTAFDLSINDPVFKAVQTIIKGQKLYLGEHLGKAYGFYSPILLWFGCFFDDVDIFSALKSDLNEVHLNIVKRIAGKKVYRELEKFCTFKLLSYCLDKKLTRDEREIFIKLDLKSKPPLDSLIVEELIIPYLCEYNDEENFLFLIRNYNLDLKNKEAFKHVIDHQNITLLEVFLSKEYVEASCEVNYAIKKACENNNLKMAQLLYPKLNDNGKQLAIKKWGEKLLNSRL